MLYGIILLTPTLHSPVGNKIFHLLTSNFFSYILHYGTGGQGKVRLVKSFFMNSFGP